MTARILVAYGSKNGATAEIAEAIADELRCHNVDAECLEAGDVRGDLDGYDAVVLGSAVYMKRWQRSARHFLRKHADELAERPFWVFSSGYVGEDSDKMMSWCEPPAVVAKVEQLGAREHVVFGGRVPAEPDNFVEKAMARDTPAEWADRRDWDEIRSWAAGIAAEAGSPTLTAARAT